MRILKFCSIVFLCFFATTYAQETQVTQIDSLKSAFKTALEPKEKAETLMQIIDRYFYEQKDSAKAYILKTLKYTEDKTELAQIYDHCLLKYAQYYIVAGDYKTAALQYEKSWERLKDNYNYFLYNKYYGDLGVLNFYQGDFKSALNNFDEALNLAKKEKNEVDQLRFLNNKALAMSYLSQGEEAIQVHEEAIKLAEKLNDSTALGKSFNNIGLIYEDMKAYEKALQYYQKALKIKEHSTSKIDVANGLYNVANMYRELGEKNTDSLYYSKADTQYELAYQAAKAVNYGKVMLVSKVGMAQLATARNKPQEAIKIYNSVLEEAEKLNDAHTLRITYLNLGVNYLKVDNFKAGEKYLLKALPLIEKSENPSDIAKISKNLALLYNKKANFKQAYKYLNKQYEIEKELSKNSLQDKISEFEIKYETEKKEKEILSQRANLAEKELNISKKNNYILGLGTLAIVLALLGYLVYNQQKMKHKQLVEENKLKEAVAKIETQNRLEEQRLRISRDLHDNIGAQLTFIISSLDNLKHGFKLPDNLNNKLKGISTFTTATIYELRDTIWAMNKNAITLDDLKSRISNFISKANAAGAHTTAFAFKIDPSLKPNYTFTSVEGMNLYRIMQEAVNNALKYAQASTILVTVEKDKGALKLSVVDDGVGFDLEGVERGSGLNNIEKRAEEMKAAVTISSKENKGTTIILQL